MMVEDDRYSATALNAEVLRFEDEHQKRNDPWRKQLAQALVDVRAAIGKRDNNEDRRPLFSDYSEVDSAEYTATQWLVDGMVSRGGIAMLGAEPKSCKTWLASEIAVSVATGTRVCGEYAAQTGKVAYFFAEDLSIQVRNRVRSLLAGKGLAPADVFGRLFVCPRGRFLDITCDEDLAWVVASCRAIGPLDLVVLDPLRDIHSASEDKSDEMSPIMRRLRLLGELLTCTVAVAHHASKPSQDTARRRPGQRMRGSSAIYGSTDSGIYFGLRDGGDGISRFELEVDVEIKGGRSAGNLNLVLDVDDDGNGAAVKASWSIKDGEKKNKGGRPKGSGHSDQEVDDEVFDFVRELAMRGEVMSQRKLRDHEDAPFADQLMRSAMRRLQDAGKLVRDGLVVRIHQPSRGGSS